MNTNINTPSLQTFSDEAAKNIESYDEITVKGLSIHQLMHAIRCFGENTVNDKHICQILFYHSQNLIFHEHSITTAEALGISKNQVLKSRCQLKKLNLCHWEGEGTRKTKIARINFEQLAYHYQFEIELFKQKQVLARHKEEFKDKSKSSKEEIKESLVESGFALSKSLELRSNLNLIKTKNKSFSKNNKKGLDMEDKLVELYQTIPINKQNPITKKAALRWFTHLHQMQGFTLWPNKMQKDYLTLHSYFEQGIDVDKVVGSSIKARGGQSYILIEDNLPAYEPGAQLPDLKPKRYIDPQKIRARYLGGNLNEPLHYHLDRLETEGRLPDGFDITAFKNQCEQDKQKIERATQ